MLLPRGHHFTHATLEPVEVNHRPVDSFIHSHIVSFVAVFPFLPKLATLSLELTDALRLAPRSNVPLSESEEYTLAAFATAAKRARHLIFCDTSTPSPYVSAIGTSALRLFTNLRALSLLTF